MGLLIMALYTVLCGKLYTILRYNQYLFQNVQNNKIFDIFKMFKKQQLN